MLQTDEGRSTGEFGGQYTQLLDRRPAPQPSPGALPEEKLNANWHPLIRYTVPNGTKLSSKPASLRGAPATRQSPSDW